MALTHNQKRRRTNRSADELYAETAATLKLCGIRELWETGELTDLVLCADCVGTSDESPPIKVHSVIMAAYSPTLIAMLCNGMRESKQSTIVLRDIAPVTLSQLVRFMYTDSLQIGPDSASALFVASDMLGMTSAKELCISWLEKHVNVESAVTVLDLADRHCCPGLQEVCELYICRHFTEFTTMLRAGATPITGLSESRVLAHDALTVDTEIKVVDAIRIWETQGSEERKDGLYRLIASGAVRLPLLTDEELELVGRSMQDQSAMIPMPLANKATARNRCTPSQLNDFKLKSACG